MASDRSPSFLWRRRQPERPVLFKHPPPGVARARIVSNGRNLPPLRLGLHTTWHSDFYHSTLVVSWWMFLVVGAVFYLALNVLFACLYLLRPGTIDHAQPGSFSDAFFFSIQTMATIGYGVLTPSGVYANLVVTAETMVSLVFVAFVTGVTFARFSRPTARVSFSNKVTVAPYNGVPTLTVRLSNSRRSQIIEATVTVTLLRNEKTTEGQMMRRFFDLALSRSHTPVFALTFTVMHPIDESSPLFGETPESLAASQSELLVSVTGLDETMSQTIHARTSYLAEDILFGQRFRDMFAFTEAGRLVIDYEVFHEVEEIGPEPPASPVMGPEPGEQAAAST